MPPTAITKYQPTPQGLTELATLLHANVHDGASVSFVLPFTLEDATDWWQTRVLPDPKRILLVATQNKEIVGSVQLLLDTPKPAARVSPAPSITRRPRSNPSPSSTSKFPRCSSRKRNLANYARLFRTHLQVAIPIR
jgi:hypothetical protein